MEGHRRALYALSDCIMQSNLIHWDNHEIFMFTACSLTGWDHTVIMSFQVKKNGRGAARYPENFDCKQVKHMERIL